MVEEEEVLAVADPALLARLRRIDDALEVMQAEQQLQSQRLAQIADAVERRNLLLNQWVDPALDLGWLMAQLAEIGRMNQTAIRELSTQFAADNKATRSAISLAVAAIEVREVEVG